MDYSGSFTPVGQPEIFPVNVEQPTELWTGSTQFKYAPPRNGDSWEACKKVVDKYDEDMCRGWDDDISNLLVFAGLFTAIVTAFTVESYQWLDDDPQELTNQLLSQLVALQRGEIQSELAAQRSLASAIRINICWFLSITLGLSSALLGILCKQWLREYRSDSTLPSQDALRLRQLRYEGLMAWGIPRIVESLPIILQSAVVLFFIGLLDLLWERDRIVAVCVTVVIGVTLTVVFLSTIIPSFYYQAKLWHLESLTSLWAGLIPAPEVFDLRPCPYKSPQSLMFLWFSSFVFAILRKLFPLGGRIPSLVSKITSIVMLQLFRTCRWLKSVLEQSQSLTSPSWNFIERRLLMADDIGAIWLPPSFSPNSRSYLQRQMKWLHDTFQNNVDVCVHLFHCLSDSDPTVIRNTLDDGNQDSVCPPELLFYKFLDGKLDQREDLTDRQRMKCFLLELVIRSLTVKDSHQFVVTTQFGHPLIGYKGKLLPSYLVYKLWMFSHWIPEVDEEIRIQAVLSISNLLHAPPGDDGRDVLADLTSSIDQIYVIMRIMWRLDHSPNLAHALEQLFQRFTHHLETHANDSTNQMTGLARAVLTDSGSQMEDIDKWSFYDTKLFCFLHDLLVRKGIDLSEIVSMWPDSTTTWVVLCAKLLDAGVIDHTRVESYVDEDMLVKASLIPLPPSPSLSPSDTSTENVARGVSDSRSSFEP